MAWSKYRHETDSKAVNKQTSMNWRNIVKKSGVKLLQRDEVLIKLYRKQFKLFLLNVVQQATESWAVLSFSQNCSLLIWMNFVGENS